MIVRTSGESGPHPVVHLEGEKAVLLPERAMWLPEYRTLLIADLHIGKAMHFRKAGIAIPEAVADRDRIRFQQLLRQWQPREVLFLGDLFHSRYNSEWDAFGLMISRYRKTRFSLVTGNHDILDPDQYLRFGIHVHPESASVGRLWLTHDAVADVPTGMYNLSGHIHPGYRLSGRGRQSAVLPCFLYGEHHGLLPAFGAFTGMKTIEARHGDRVWVVLGDEVVRVPDNS